MIRIGIVGCGRILAAHLRGYRLLREAGIDNFRITALCARKENDARMYVKRGEGPVQRPAVSDIPGDPLAVGDEFLSDFQDDVEVEVFTDYREMIAQGSIDAVNDFTTHGMHHLIAEESFKHGKHLLSQKPMSVSITAARTMCEQADAHECTFGVFENFRFSGTSRYLHWLFETGQIGKLQMITLGYAGVWWAPNRIVAETPWRHELAQGGGITLDLGVHFLDQMRYVAGEVKSVSGIASVLQPERVTINKSGDITERISCDADDTFMANVEFESGVIANMFASWSGTAPPVKVEAGMVYYGSEGRASGPNLYLADGKQQSLEEYFDKHASSEVKERYFPKNLGDSFALNQLDWLRAIEEKKAPEIDGWEGLRDLAAAYAILESHAAGRKVELEEVLQGQLNTFQQPINNAFGIQT